MIEANRASFVARLQRGYHWQLWLAARWCAKGLPAYVPPLRISPDLSLNADYVDEGDIFLMCGTVGSKSRNLSFTQPSDFPFDDALVCATRVWDDTDLAIAMISTVTKCVLLIPATTRPQWKVMRVFDHARGYEYDAFACPKLLLRTEAAFVEWAKRQ